jgi:hypothetical protein
MSSWRNATAGPLFHVAGNDGLRLRLVGNSGGGRADLPGEIEP